MKKNTEKQVLVTNKKAYHNYHILEEYEAGIVLSGYEVKSLRLHNASLVDSIVKFTNAAAKKNEGSGSAEASPE